MPGPEPVIGGITPAESPGGRSKSPWNGLNSGTHDAPAHSFPDRVWRLFPLHGDVSQPQFVQHGV